MQKAGLIAAVVVSSATVAAVIYMVSGSVALGAGAALPDLSGTYWATTYSPKIQVIGGGDPPLNDAGRTAYQKNQQGLRSGTLDDPARKVCLPDGVPRVLETPYPFEVFQLPPGQVTFVHELNHHPRQIWLERDGIEPLAGI